MNSSSIDKLPFTSNFESSLNSVVHKDFRALPKFFINFLSENGVKFSKKKRQSFVCISCNDFCETSKDALAHILSSGRHIRRYSNHWSFKHIPFPSESHKLILSDFLNGFYFKYGLNLNDLTLRQKKFEALSQQLLSDNISFTLHLIGSSVSGFGFKNSDINCGLVSEMSPHKSLPLLYKYLISNESIFSCVGKDFDSEVPEITFSYKDSFFSLTIYDSYKHQTSLLLYDYWRLDSRVRVLGLAFRKWANICDFETPASGGLPSYSLPLFVIQYCCIEGLLPLLYNGDSSETFYSSQSQVLNSSSSSSWKSTNTQSIAELWIGLFHFYGSLFKKEICVFVNIRSPSKVEQDSTFNQNKRLYIEDPFLTKRNLCNTIVNYTMFEYIMDCFLKAYSYFGIIQTDAGPLISHISADLESYSKFYTTTERKKQNRNFEDFIYKHGTIVSPEDGRYLSKIVPKNKIFFKFEARFLCRKKPVKYCGICSRTGHILTDCKQFTLLPSKPHHHITNSYLKILNNVCKDIVQKYEPSLEYLKEQKEILSFLTYSFKKDSGFSKIVLSLFGSSCNGFPFFNSDLDVCMTLSKDTPSPKETLDILKTLTSILHKMKDITNVELIATARVPIVKFYLAKYQREVDISLYNILALENTKMLRMYSQIDKRVKILGYCVKFVSKICFTESWTKHRLSSYSFILLMLYYLQQISPPVIPVLQEWKANKNSVHLIDGWNTWFYNDLRQLLKDWKVRNHQSVGELWIGFLNFYGFNFDDSKIVVCIRRFEPLTKFEKLWNSKKIAIEDPFNLDHNLGNRSSFKLHITLKMFFRQARDHFAKPFPLDDTLSISNYVKYYFDANKLMMTHCRKCKRLISLLSNCHCYKRNSFISSDEMKKKNDRKTIIKASPHNPPSPHHNKEHEESFEDELESVEHICNTSFFEKETQEESSNKIGKFFKSQNTNQKLPPTPMSGLRVVDLEKSFDILSYQSKAPPGFQTLPTHSSSTHLITPPFPNFQNDEISFLFPYNQGGTFNQFPLGATSSSDSIIKTSWKTS